MTRSCFAPQSFADLLANLPMKRSSDLRLELGLDLGDDDVTDDSLLPVVDLSPCSPNSANSSQHDCPSTSPATVSGSTAGSGKCN